MRIVETVVVSAQDSDKLNEARLKATKEIAHKYGDGTMISFIPAEILIVQRSADE